MTKNVPNTPADVHIGVLAYGGVQMSADLGLADLLDVANRYGAENGGRRVKHSILRADDLPAAPSFDAIVLPPNLTGNRGASDGKLHEWIRDRHAWGTIACSACAGAFWLGHAGLLDGRPVTTHWALEEEFRAAFPQADLNSEHILIDDNDIVTTGGVMAWVDLGLHLVSRWMGRAIVSQVCRHMLIDPHGREQRNYRSFRPKLDHGDRPIVDLQRWMEGHAQMDLSVAALARQSSLSERTLQRRFSHATGLSISAYVQELRVEKARGLLERTAMPMSEICWAVGYEDPSAFSRLFKSVSGTTTRDYRKRFTIR